MEIEKTCKVEELLSLLFSLEKDTLYDVSIKQHKEKRSLNANSYYWAICNKIGNKMRISKEEVHELMIRRYGQSVLLPYPSNTDMSRLHKYYDKVKDTSVDGFPITWYKVYIESHTYNKEEMSILIDGVVGEAQDLGIETMTPNEIERLKSLWQSKA